MGLPFAILQDFDKSDYSTDFLSEYINYTSTNAYNNTKHHNRLAVIGNQHSKIGHFKAKDCPKPLLYIPTIKITAFLPPKLEYLDISHSKIGLPIYDFYIDPNNSVKIINASYSLLYCWAGPIHGGINVEIIDLSNNFCSVSNENVFINFPKLKRVHLQGNYLYDLVKHKSIFNSNSELEYVDLSTNKINNIHPNFFKNQTKMRWIYLSKNNLIEFDHRLAHMSFLNVLNLSENRIYTLSNTLRSDLDDIVSSRNNDTLTADLSKNFIACSCDNLEVLEWILEHTAPTSNLLSVKISTCYYIHNISALPSPIAIWTKNDLVYQITFLQKFCTSYSSLLITLVVILFVVVNIIVASFIHRLRWKIRYWYYVGHSNDTTSNDYTALDNSLRFSRFKYAIYLAYEEDAREFVLETLKPKLIQFEYVVFVHDDILDGLPLCNVLTKSIHASRVVVFILSNGSRQSLEWNIAAHITNEESNYRGKPISLAMFYNSDSTQGLPENLQLLRHDAFIDYPRNGSDGEITAFWEDLKTKVNVIVKTT
ncbi:toll-like receptor 4 isoform X1 [Dreissena polymorpha]|nr:toll-like receptor 4 isoform X1 [Dreissena polymorpha]